MTNNNNNNNKKQVLESEKYNHLRILSRFLPQSDQFDLFFKDIYRPQDDRLRRFRRVVMAKEPEYITRKRLDIIRQVNEFNEECAALGEKELEPFQDVIKEDERRNKAAECRKTMIDHCIEDETSPKTVYLTDPYNKQFLVCNNEDGKKTFIYALKPCDDHHCSRVCYQDPYFFDRFCPWKKDLQLSMSKNSLSPLVGQL